VSTILITGANRGIGLQLCKQFSTRGDDVIAVCRNSSAELDALPVRVVTGVDVGDAAGMPNLKDAIGDQTLDVLLNNAGILRRDNLDSLDYDAMTEQFRINSLGPLRVTEALLDNLSTGSKVIIISSRMGSIEDNTSGGYYGYRASKTAVNQIGTSLRHDLAPRGIAVALLHPGMVATEMTGGQGVTAEDSAEGLINRIDALNQESSGTFWHAEGYPLPW
jgi:NAD(P)-dependent dehydrogenase (short-subunit alcohol dehydrogenase family)